MFKKQSNSVNTASVNEGFLILTLTTSVTPVVWRLELEKAKNASFEIQEQDNGHALTIKAPRKSLEIIGLFNEQDDAFDALMSVSSALQNNAQNSTPAKTTSNKEAATPNKDATNNRLIVMLLATCFVIGLFYYYWGRVIPTTQTFETQTLSETASDPANRTGVPVSADDLLKGF